MNLKYLSLFLYSSFVFSQSYQVGVNWSKEHINRASSKNQYLKESVGEVGASATLFYIGVLNNKHWAITNNHVCPNSIETSNNECINQSVYFHYYRNSRGKELSGKISSVPLVIKALDFALIEITFDNLDTFLRQPRALRLSSAPLYQGQDLISLGFGVHKNDYGSLMIEEDSFECQIFSKEIRLMNDPDEANPTKDIVHSFLHGCDVSHGDSGSPILDRNTKEVVGLLWSGKFPKSKDISKKGFEQLPLSYLWQQLNYASPAFMIKKELDQFFNNLN